MNKEKHIKKIMKLQKKLTAAKVKFVDVAIEYGLSSMSEADYFYMASLDDERIPEIGGRNVQMHHP